MRDQRKQALQSNPDTNKNFIWEMRRFLPPTLVSATVESEAFREKYEIANAEVNTQLSGLTPMPDVAV